MSEKECPDTMVVNGTKYVKEKAPEGPLLAVGRKVFIRSITHYYTGRISRIDDTMIELTEAAWIADTGRFSEALKSGALKEVEPFPSTVAVFRGGIVDLTEWKHDLPRETK